MLHNSRLSENDAQQYLERRVQSSWLDFFDSFDIRIVDTIVSLSSKYPSVTSDSFHLRNKTGKTNSFLYPRLQEILMPFRAMCFDNVKAVIFIDEPSTKGISGGIPFLYNLESHPFLTPGDRLDSKYNWSPNIVLLENHMMRLGLRDSRTPLSDVKTRTVPLFDTLSLYSKGILVLYSVFTCDSLIMGSHEPIWMDVIQCIASQFTQANIPVAFINQRLGRKLVEKIAVPNLFAIYPDIREISQMMDNDTPLLMEELDNPFDFIKEFIV